MQRARFVALAAAIVGTGLLVGALRCNDVEGDDEGDVEPPAPRAEARTVTPTASRSTELPTVALQQVVDGLVAPTSLEVGADGSMILLDQPGLAYRIVEGELAPFADLRERVVDLDRRYDERGLLGIALHPRFPEDRRVYLYYSTPLRQSAPRGWDHMNVLTEFSIDAEGELDEGSARELMVLAWPYSNHDGGTLAFGPDEMLYLSLGDGGYRNDVGRGHPSLGNGQDWTTLMGSILRIDPDGGDPYGVPSDNPFVGDHPGADEIWAHGLRNPYAFSFDAETGALFAGDVGQLLMEEVDIIRKGGNYGWNIREGTLCFDERQAIDPPEDCPDRSPHGQPLLDPILTYTLPGTPVSGRSRIHGRSVIGGYVYRGRAIEGLQGAYVFGDWTTSNDAPRGQLFVARRSENGRWSFTHLRLADVENGHIGRFVRKLGQDEEGELYVLTSRKPGPTGRTGALWRIVPAGSGR